MLSDNMSMQQFDWSSTSTFDYYAKISDDIVDYKDEVNSSFQISSFVKGVVSRSGLGHPIAPASIELMDDFVTGKNLILKFAL